MTLLGLYENTSRRIGLTQGRFLSLYNSCVSELLSRYSPKYVLLSPDGSFDGSIPDIHDEPLCHPEYDQAIISAIIYAFNPERTDCAEKSLVEREAAYRTVWRKLNKRKRANERWWE